MNKQVKALKALGYKVHIAFVDTDPNESWRRMAARWISTGRLIPPSYMATAAVQPATAFKDLLASGTADSYTHIDNNPGHGQPRNVIRGGLAGL